MLYLENVAGLASYMLDNPESNFFQILRRVLRVEEIVIATQVGRRPMDYTGNPKRNKALLEKFPDVSPTYHRGYMHISYGGIDNFDVYIPKNKKGFVFMKLNKRNSTTWYMWR